MKFVAFYRLTATKFNSQSKNKKSENRLKPKYANTEKQ